MAYKEQSKMRKWIAIMGMFLILCPQGIMWYWANLSVYVNSYVIRQVDEVDGSNMAQSNWFMACFEMGACVGFLVAAFLTRTVGNRLTSLFGTVMFLVALMCAYLLIDTNGLAMKMTSGFAAGIGVYVNNGAFIEYTTSLTGDDFGFFYAIVQGGLTGGPIAMNQLVTLYINPDNLDPDHKIGPSVYFSQAEVLNRVPSVFLIIAGCVVGCYIVGILMVELNTGETSKKSSDNPKRTTKSTTTMSYGTTDPGVKTYNDINIPNNNCSETSIRECSGLTDQSESSNAADMLIRQVIRTPQIYLLMVLLTIGAIAYTINGNYYKAYGQLYIKDDHFITNLSLGFLISASITRPGWGWLMDRYSLKTAYIVFFSWSGISSLCFYFSPFVNKWFYGLMTIMFTVSGGPIYIISAVACRKAFGGTHTVFNVGYVLLIPGIVMLFTPIIYQELLDSFGWFSIYALCCSWSLVAIIICIFSSFKIEKFKTSH